VAGGLTGALTGGTGGAIGGKGGGVGVTGRLIGGTGGLLGVKLAAGGVAGLKGAAGFNGQGVTGRGAAALEAEGWKALVGSIGFGAGAETPVQLGLMAGLGGMGGLNGLGAVKLGWLAAGGGLTGKRTGGSAGTAGSGIRGAGTSGFSSGFISFGSAAGLKLGSGRLATGGVVAPGKSALPAKRSVK
jgi:hypothetical protein